MARIRTIQPQAATGALRAVYDRLGPQFPPEYARAAPADAAAGLNPDGVVSAHSLLPTVMEPIFQALVALMSPDLPLTRRQHEMVNTVVSQVNRCQY